MILNKKIGILTSSRADYGIYKNLLDLFKSNKNIELIIIAFGMHLQKQHGDTLNEIKKDNFNIITVQGMPYNDSKYDISNGYGEIVKSFSNLWNDSVFDVVFALGDRFEMNAAVQSGIPFEVNFAHIHGGEISLGSIDNIYRDQISIASKIHFTSTTESRKRLLNMLINNKNIYNVGSLSIDRLNFLELPNWFSVCQKFDIPNKPFALITFHPETINNNNNTLFVEILIKTLSELCKSIHLVITQANADSYGNLYRQMSVDLKNKFPKRISVINSFGKLNYFSAMKNSNFLLGNTSSGIIEAASFGKYVFNVGDRQSGRVRSENIIDVKYDKEEILEAIAPFLKKQTYKGLNRYKLSNTALKIYDNTLKYLN